MNQDAHQYVLGVDVGGTKIAIGLVDRAGIVSKTLTEPIKKGEMLDPVYQIADMSRRLLAQERLPHESVTAMGMAVPAVVDTEEGTVVWAPNIPNWRDVPLRRVLEEELGFPVYFDFDGHVSVLGEQWVGAGKGADTAIFLIVGTGIGAGLWLDGRLYRGATGIAGGVGWYPLQMSDLAEGKRSQRGFFEEITAGPGIAQRAIAEVKSGRDSLMASMVDSPDHITARTVFDAYADGDKLAEEVVERALLALGMGVSNIVSTLNPEVVIVGGGVGTRLGQLNLLGKVEAFVKEVSQPQAASAVRIVAPQLGSLVGVVGAARLAYLNIEGRA